MDANTKSSRTAATANPAAKVRTQTLPVIPRPERADMSRSEQCARPAAAQQGLHSSRNLDRDVDHGRGHFAHGAVGDAQPGATASSTRKAAASRGWSDCCMSARCWRAGISACVIEPAAYEFVVYDTRRDLWLMLDQEREFGIAICPKALAFSCSSTRKPWSSSPSTEIYPTPRRRLRRSRSPRAAKARHFASSCCASDTGKDGGRRRCARQSFAGELQQSGKAELRRLRRPAGFTLVEVLGRPGGGRAGIDRPDGGGQRHGAYQRLFARQILGAMDCAQSPRPKCASTSSSSGKTPIPASLISPTANGTTIRATSIPASPA